MKSKINGQNEVAVLRPIGLFFSLLKIEMEQNVHIFYK